MWSCGYVSKGVGVFWTHARPALAGTGRTVLVRDQFNRGDKVNPPHYNSMLVITRVYEERSNSGLVGFG
jgi:hypothetical protein